MARVVLPMVPDTKRCACFRAPVDDAGSYSPYPQVLGGSYPVWVNSIIGSAVDPSEDNPVVVSQRARHNEAAN